MNAILVAVIAVLFIAFSVLWIRIGRGHLAFGICLFLPIFAILNYLKKGDENMLPWAIASISLILVAVFRSNVRITGIILGLESVAACITAISLLPFFPKEVYESFMMWIAKGGQIVLVILFWPLAVGLCIIAKASNDMRGW